MIIIPMVGRSSRFFDVGYEIPKYQLPLKGGVVFDMAVMSFERYFQSDFFRFIVRSDFESESFVRSRVEALGIYKFDIIVIDYETLGQADTVAIGLEGVNQNEPIFIFNIDTFRPGFVKRFDKSECAGYLEVFQGEGDHWSFVKSDGNNGVLRTTEKERISNLCSDGLYYFSSAKVYLDAFRSALESNSRVGGELYVAPLYNHLIASGLTVKFFEVSSKDIIFCGTPTEYLSIAEAYI
jgi:hypothetical protein